MTSSGSSEYLRLWSVGHGGIEPRGLVRGWLLLVFFLVRPLVARRVPPGWVTTASACAAVAVPLVVLAGRWWLLLAAGLAVACALLDGLDGAVAVLTGTATAWGRVLDPLSDRVGDLAFLVALVLAGAPGPLAAGVGALTLLQESVRSSARLPDVGVVTVWERPTRVILTALGLVGAAVTPALPVALVATAFAAALAVTGFVQLVVVVRRRLRGQVLPDQPGGDLGGQGHQG